MPSSPARLFGVAIAALLPSACDLAVPTEVQTPVDLALDFCSNDVPVWFAYQNQGAPATRVHADPSGTFRFTASNRVIVAMVWQNGSDYRTEIVLATNRELETMSGRACLEELGTKTVNGTVAGFGGGQIAVVGMNFASVTRQPGNTAYSLANLADRPLDLIGSRQQVTAGRRSADRVVIRRTQTFVNNATVSLIDFAGPEALPTATANAAVSGIFSTDFAYVQNNFFSQLETSHSLTYAEGIGNGTHAFASLPTSALAAGDYHDLILLAVEADGSGVRGAENFFRAAANQTLALGPPLVQPTISPGPSGNYVRLRVELPLQLSYDDAISVDFSQQFNLSVTSVRLWATFGFVNAVIGGWTVEIPDLSAAAGWQDVWGLSAGSEIHWTVTAYGGRSELMFGAKPNDGEFIRYGIRHSVPTPALRAASFPMRLSAARRP